jgi:tRNA(fMet)-specific endonuclease VapC
MHLLDSDTLTYLHAGHPRVVDHLQTLEDPLVGTTIITRIEVLRGRFDFLLKAATGAELLRAQHLLALSEELLSQLMVVPVDEAAAIQFERLRATRSLKKIGRADLLIASIALAHRATLVTRNLRHFRQIAGLSLANWVDD